MREISGDLHIVDYKTKMVIASLKPEDYIEDLRHWELKDNADILDIKLLDESPFLIYFQQKNLILKETRPGVITPYVITEIAKDSAAHTATVYASGEWIKLDKDAYISPQKITSKDAAYYMNFATARTVWEVGVIEAVGTRTMTIDTFVSPLRFIKEVATLFDNVEIQYRIVMNPTKPPTRYIDLVKKRGRETDKEIILGKDLLGIKRIENSENIITALVPFVMGRDADGNDKLITIESVNNGLQYIVDDAAYQRWNVDGKHLFGFYTPETDNEDMAPARLLTLAKTELKKRVDTIVSYEVDSVDISRVFGYEHEAVGEGDTIRIIDEGMTPTLYLEARAVVGDESRKDKRKSKYTFGNFVEIINPDEALRKLYQKMLTMIGDKVPKEWFGALETKLEETKKKADTAAEESQTAKDLANATKDYMEQNLVDIIESVKPPTANLNPNKTLWLDSSDPANKILKMYKGNGVWERIVPDTSATDKEFQALIKEVQSLDGEMTAVQKQVGEQAGEINKKVDRTWLDQEMLKKANADNVYTKEYVDKNLVGKQVYDVDKQANIKAFSDMNTKYEQTAEALKLTATKEELKQTNTNVTNVTKTANEVKISADENSKKIEKVEGDFKNMKIGSVNLAIESEFICDVKNATANYSSLKSLETSKKVIYRNKKLTLSYILTGNITGKGTNPWMGAELVVRYGDGTTEYLSMRRDTQPVGTAWTESLQSAIFTLKDKDITAIGITAGSRDVFGNINIKHLQLEEGTVATSWGPAIEEAVSTGEFTQTTNEITQKVDSNTAKITKVESSFTNNNYLVQSSANNEYPEFAGDVGGHQASRSTMTFENDYIKLVSTDGLDSFYQIGNYKLNDMRGLSPNQDYTLSVDAKGDAGFCHLVLFEHNGTGWYEAKQIPTKISPDTFTRISATFKLSINAKAFILRIRYPMSANSTGKVMTFKNVKLEDGLIPTRWTPAGIDEKTFVKTTNEIKQTVDTNSQKITSVETKVNTLNTDVTEITKKTNEIIQTVDENSATISKLEGSLAGGNQNMLVDSSANNVNPRFADEPYTTFNKATGSYFEDYIIMTVSDYTDAFYQLGATTSANMRGCKVGDTLTFSLDLLSDIANVSTIFLQYTNGGWSETQLKDHNSTSVWSRVSHTVTLGANTTGWMLRIRAPRVADTNGKKMRFRKFKLEKGSIATAWDLNPTELATSVQFNTIKQTVDSNTAEIGKVASTQGTQGTLIQENKSAITQLNNQIKSKVSDTQMQEYVGGLGSENLFLNTAFEDRVINASTGSVTSRTPSITKWTTYANGSNLTAIPESARHHDGFNSVKMEVTSQTVDKNSSIFQDVGAVPESGDHVLSAWFYTDNKALLDQGAYIDLAYYNGGTWVASKTLQIAPLLVNNSWVRISVTLPTPTSAITKIRPIFVIKRNGRMWISQPMLQKGKTPSAFLENPKELGNYDQMIAEIGKKVATSDFNSKVTTMETNIDQNTKAISLRAEKTEVYTKNDSDGRYGSKAIVERHESELQVQSKEINLRVKSGDVASTINQTAQSVLIQADKIYLNGFIEAKHLKAQELVGVTIKTAPNGQQRYVKLNQQNIELYDKDTVRAEFRFFNKSDGTAINPTLTLGRSVSGGIVGALNLTQWTPINAQGVDNYQNAQATIGMVEQYNSTSNEFTYGSRINFFQGGAMDLKANDNLIINASQKGYIWLKTDSIGTNTDIFIEPSKDFKVTAGNNTVINSKGYFDSTSESGRHYFGKKDKPSTQNHMQLYDNNSDADLSLAFLRLRASHVTGYTSGFQIKNATGDEFRDLEARNIKCVSLQQTSTRLIKTGIKDIEISSLEKIMGLKTQQYYFKSDMDKLYKKREGRVEGDPLPTIADIPLQYGFIAEDSDIVFTTDDKTAINLYPVVALTVDSVQHIKLTQDEHGTRITQLEVELEVQKLEIVELDKRIVSLEELVQKMINGAPTTENTTQPEQP